MNVDEKPSAWTPEIVRDHVVSLIDANDRRYDDRFAAQEKAVNSALIASEKAVLVAETNAEKWRANANEWRAAMSDREGRFASRGDLESIKERLDRSEGKGTGMNAMWGFVVGGVGLLAALLAVFVSFRSPSAATPQVVYVPAPPGALLPSTPPTVPR